MSEAPDDNNHATLTVNNYGQVRPTTSMVLSENPQLDDALILRLQYDLAIGIHLPDAIAQRYGLRDKEDLREYLRRHPQIVENARKAKALVDSNQSVEGRVRIKAMYATEDLIHTTHEIAQDIRTPMQQRLDAFKQLSRVAGVDGLRDKTPTTGSGGHSFVLNILFTDETKTIQGTVVDSAQVAPPPMGTISEPVADDNGFGEQNDEPEDEEGF
jgi:hypothetical protein